MEILLLWNLFAYVVERDLKQELAPASSWRTALYMTVSVESKMAWQVSLMFNLGPNSLIFSFSSGASPAHNAGGHVLPLFSQQAFLTKEVGKRDGKMIVTHRRRVLLDAVL